MPIILISPWCSSRSRRKDWCKSAPRPGRGTLCGCIPPTVCCWNNQSFIGFTLVVEHLGPFWIHLDPYGPFSSKPWFSAPKTQVLIAEGLLRKINFGLKRFKWTHTEPKWDLWYIRKIVDKRATFGHFWSPPALKKYRHWYFVEVELRCNLYQFWMPTTPR